MATVDELLRMLGGFPCTEIEEGVGQAKAAGIGPYPETPVGPVYRSIRIYYGPLRFAPLDAEERAMRKRDPHGVKSDVSYEHAEESARDITRQLYAACRLEKVDLWVGSREIGIGCILMYDAGAKWSLLAESIRAARIRALEHPGQGHEGTLALLMAEAESV